MDSCHIHTMTATDAVAGVELTDLSFLPPLSLPLCVCVICGHHHQVIDAITRHLDLGSYLEWTEEQKTAWLLEGGWVCVFVNV